MFSNIETIKSVTVVFIYVFKSSHKVRAVFFCDFNENWNVLNFY